MDRKLLIHKDFLRTLPSSLTAALEARAQLRRFADGQTLFRRGDEAHGLYGVRSGRVQVVGPGADGRELVLTVLAPGEWFGELSLFDGLPRTHDNVAVGDTELWHVPNRECHELMRESPEFYPAFAELMAHRIRMLFLLLEDATLLDLPRRLAKRILELAADHGSEAEGALVIDLHLPQEQLAAMVGATREAVGRHLKKWEREGWIRLAYGRIELIDAPGLEGLL